MTPEQPSKSTNPTKKARSPKDGGKTKSPAKPPAKQPKLALDSEDEEEDQGIDTRADEPEQPAAASSFASDRRIVRLLIARYWSDALIKRYSDETDNAGG